MARPGVRWANTLWTVALLTGLTGCPVTVDVPQMPAGEAAQRDDEAPREGEPAGDGDAAPPPADGMQRDDEQTRGDVPPPPDGEEPGSGEQPPPDGAQPPPEGAEGEQPPPDGEQPPPDGEQPPPDGEQPPEGEGPGLRFCADDVQSMCCGDAVCDGPETHDNCAEDCEAGDVGQPPAEEQPAPSGQMPTNPPTCGGTLTTRSCGDDFCGGPETAENCAADCG
jgi:hypothetical protein